MGSVDREAFGAKVRRVARPRQPRPEPAMRELLAFERAYRRRLAELDAGLVQLRAERDEAMMRAYRAGIPIVEIAQVFTISHQRVSALVGRHKR